MTKQEKIEKILRQANVKFVSLILPKEEVKNKLLAQLDQAETDLKLNNFYLSKEIFKLKLYKLASLGAIALVMLLILGGTTVYAANQSLPGDILYPVNRKIEDINLALAPNPAQRHRIIIIHLQKRAKEWEKIKTNNKDVQVLTNNEKLAMKNMKDALAKTITELQTQKQKYINGSFEQASEKQQFEENIERMNEIMAQHLQFLRNRENEIEQGINSGQDDKKEIEDLAASMNAEIAEHNQMLQAVQMISQ